jgi:peroxiredoxin
MRQLRNGVPILGIVALIALFLKMPEVPNVLGIFKCETCVRSEPYLPMIGAGYFALLLAVSMLFPKFPSLLIARGGLIWAILLGLALTFIDLPNWCAACTIGHMCNIAIWTIWCLAPSVIDESRASPLRERLFLTFLAPIIIIALFSCLNLTFMVYNLKSKQKVLSTSLKTGDSVPPFTIKNDRNDFFVNTDIAATTGTFINFVSPNCPYCKEQLSVLNDTIIQLVNDAYRFITFSPALTPDLVQQSSTTEWFEDKEGELRKLFKVTGYPTLFVVGADGKILQIISGVSNELKSALLIEQINAK